MLYKTSVNQFYSEKLSFNTEIKFSTVIYSDLGMNGLHQVTYLTERLGSRSRIIYKILYYLTLLDVIASIGSA